MGPQAPPGASPLDPVIRLTTLNAGNMKGRSNPRGIIDIATPELLRGNGSPQLHIKLTAPKAAH